MSTEIASQSSNTITPSEIPAPHASPPSSTTTVASSRTSGTSNGPASVASGPSAMQTAVPLPSGDSAEGPEMTEQNGGQITNQLALGQELFPPTTLYVGDLDLEVDEQILWQKFSSCGPIYSIRVCRDFLSTQSLGYAYVNFQNSSDAENALRLLNYEVLIRRPMRIMWSEKDPSLRRSGVGNIFIKNLNKTITAKELHDTFISFGRIMSCKIMLDDNGQSKGFGFIHFDNQKSADEAIGKVNGMLVKDKKVYVAKFKPKIERLREMDGKEQRFNNIYIKNFGNMFTDDSLKQLFEKFGPIISAKVMTNEANESRGFGFVSFHDPDHAKKAVEEMNGYKLDENHEMYVARAQKKQERASILKQQYEQMRRERLDKTRGINLYVKHFNHTVDDAALHSLFERFGHITSAKVMRNENGTSREFGFVCFSQPEEATRALTEMNGKVVYDGKPLYVALSQTKEERRANLRINFGRRAARQFRPIQMPPNQQPPYGQQHPATYMNNINPATALYQQNPAAMAATFQHMTNLSPLQHLMQQMPTGQLYQQASPMIHHHQQQQQQQQQRNFYQPTNYNRQTMSSTRNLPQTLNSVRTHGLSATRNLQQQQQQFASMAAAAATGQHLINSAVVSNAYQQQQQQPSNVNIPANLLNGQSQQQHHNVRLNNTRAPSRRFPNPGPFLRNAQVNGAAINPTSFPLANVHLWQQQSLNPHHNPHHQQQAQFQQVVAHHPGGAHQPHQQYLNAGTAAVVNNNENPHAVNGHDRSGYGNLFRQFDPNANGINQSQ
ncbi:hypothetical protein ACOME3_009959 [Neoechinorhynchus agilis]